MVMEDMADYYYSVSNAINFKDGIVKDGSNIFKNGKNLEIHRELSGSLAVWDSSSIGRIEIQ